MCHGWLNSDDAHTERSPLKSNAGSGTSTRTTGPSDRRLLVAKCSKATFTHSPCPWYTLRLWISYARNCHVTYIQNHTKSYKINTQHAEAPMNPQPFHHQCFVGDSLVHLPFVTAYTSLYVYMYNYIYIYIYIWLYMFTWVVLEVCSKHGIESTGSSSFTGFHIMQSH